MKKRTRTVVTVLIGVVVIGLAAAFAQCAGRPTPPAMEPALVGSATATPGATAPAAPSDSATAEQPTPVAEDDVPMVRVPAGEFLMGSTAEDILRWEKMRFLTGGGYYDYISDEWPQMTVYLDEFEIDQYEVTYARYERCVEAGVCSPLREPTPSPEYPVLVEWADANAYCQWVDKRLPTEAEWEKAARGSDGRIYPWGDEWDPSRLQIHYIQGEGLETAPVGSYTKGASPYGALDMAGNAPEWVSDLYKAYPGGQLTERIEGERNPFVARGGYHGFLGTSDPPEMLYRAADRFPRNDMSGFRCVRGAAPPVLENAIVRSSVPTPPPTLTSVDLTGMIEIPAGEFVMGSDLPDLRDTSYHSPAHVVYLDTFFIDRYEVTEAQYAEFLNALGQHLLACGGHDCILLVGESRMSFSNPSHIRKVGTQYMVEPGYENYPVNLVTWHGARAYCRWLGKRLPTEAEWEKAARGTEGRLYPWGNEWDAEKARYGEPLRPVGSNPHDVSPYGVIDMLGSVRELVSDWYAPDYYTWSPKRNPQGPAEPGENKLRVIRGTEGKELVSRSMGTLGLEGLRCAYTP